MKYKLVCENPNQIGVLFRVALEVLSTQFSNINTAITLVYNVLCGTTAGFVRQAVECSQQYQQYLNDINNHTNEPIEKRIEYYLLDFFQGTVSVKLRVLLAVIK